jgi:hypothetical protein
VAAVTKAGAARQFAHLFVEYLDRIATRDAAAVAHQTQDVGRGHGSAEVPFEIVVSDIANIKYCEIDNNDKKVPRIGEIYELMSSERGREKNSDTKFVPKGL